MADREIGQAPGAQGDQGRSVRFYVVLVLAILALIFVIQNTEETNVKFIFAEANMPLFFTLIISILLGALIGWLTPRVWHSRRDRNRD